MSQRRKRVIPVLAHKMSGEARRISLLTQALHDMRLALHRLSRELIVCLALIIFLWHIVWDLLMRVLRGLF